MAGARRDPDPADGPVDVGPDEDHGAYGDAPPPFEEGGASRRLTPRVWISIGVAAVLLAVGGFVGLKAASGGGSKSATAAAEGGPPGTPGRGGTVGTLQSVDGSTLTVATFNGATTTVITSSSTRFMKAVTGA